MRFVALLKSLNVGAHNRISMKDLAQVFVDAGCDDVSTYIQSGNVLFSASAAHARKVPALVTAALARGFDVASPVVLRDAAALAKVGRHNPFLARGEDEARLHVAFLDGAPPAAKVKALDHARWAPDAFVVQGPDIYLCLPNGVGRTRLTTSWFETQLGLPNTWRNWKSVKDLARRVESAP